MRNAAHRGGKIAAGGAGYRAIRAPFPADLDDARAFMGASAWDLKRTVGGGEILRHQGLPEGGVAAAILVLS